MAAIMKTPYAIGLVAASVLITVAIEESRIATLRSDLKAGEKSAIAKAAAAPAVSSTASEESAPPVKTKNRPEAKPVAPADQKEPDEESFAKAARKMWDNPAGKSMMNQGVKMAVAMMYEDFISGLDLSKEETDYFKSLLGKEMADQQELGMKMLGASAEERKSLGEELSRRAAAANEDIKKFLNSDEDFQKYTEYKERLPEHQQLDGIRSAMSAKGAPLDAETESRLADAMYRARTEAKVPDLQGPDAIDQLSKGNLTETFEKGWAAQQEKLGAEVGKILNETQMAAFQEYQKQMRDMQLMGLKMAEKMMPGNKDKDAGK